ncbi:AAA family ATPase [Chloroflexota bacterium]
MKRGKVIEKDTKSTLSERGILSATEIGEMEIPDITYYIEGILRPGGKATLVAKKKMAKSFLSLDLGMHVSLGKEFLGFITLPCNVLYVNFEISHEKLMERIQTIQGIREFQAPDFRSVTISQGWDLDRKPDELIRLLQTCEEGSFRVQMLIIDPRIKCMARDENESAVVNAFTRNLDLVMEAFPGLGMLIVHHEGKSTTGAGRGHSAFDGWVDTMLKIRPLRIYEGDNGDGIPSPERVLILEGRDTESGKFGVRFSYPLYNLEPSVLTANASKVRKAKVFIVKELSDVDSKEQVELRLNAISVGHSDYSFNRALNELKSEGRVAESKAPGQGNRKLLSATK